MRIDDADTATLRGVIFKPLLGSVFLLAIVACGTSRPRLAIDLRPRMNAIRADAARIATLLARGQTADAVAPADRLARADLGAVAELPDSFGDHLALFRRRAIELRDAAARGDVPASRQAFDDVVRSCADCHREARPGNVTIELRIERP